MTATVEIENDIAVITMDDGKANAISMDMLNALHACLDEAEAKAKAVVITGREARFSAGFDLKVLTGGGSFEKARELVLSGGQLALRLYKFPMPVLAACNGHAIAMGSFMLLSCDVRIGTLGDFKIGANESAIGMVIPEFAIELMKARLSPRFLHRSAINGEFFAPETAVEAGYLDEAVPAGEALPRAVKFASMIVAGTTPALAGNKTLLRQDTIARMEPVVQI